MYIAAAYRFLEYLKVVRNASEHTVRNYAIDLNALKTFMEKKLHPMHKAEELPDKIRYEQSYNDRWAGKDDLLHLNDIDKMLLREFLANMNSNADKKDGDDENKGGAAALPNKRTIVRRLASLRSFFKFCIANSITAHNPTEELENPKIEKRIPLSLSMEQVQKMFDQPDLNSYLGLRDRVIMELFYSSGLRVSELCAINRTDIDYEDLSVKLRGKGKKERIVPITHNAAEWIKAYLEHPERHFDTDGHIAEVDADAVFLNRLGTRLTTRSVDRKFDKYLNASGLAGKVTPHTLRHTIATHWLENGMDLETIKEILGHRSLSTTTIYTQVSTKLKKKVYDKTHPRAK